MKNLIIITALLIISSSCVTQKRCAELYPCTGSTDTLVRDSVVYCVRDSVVFIPADSSDIQALIECEGEIPRLKQIIAYNAGKRIEVPVIRFKDKVLYVKCQVDSSKVAFSWAEKNEYHLIKTSSQVVTKTNYLTGWQWFQLWVGRIALILLLIVVVILILKYVVKFNIPFLKM